MDFHEINDRGLVLLGCGKMGRALLEGWLVAGLQARKTWVTDPMPPEELSEYGVAVNAPLPDRPAVLVLAVKPQMMVEATRDVAGLGGGETLIVSIAAGTTIATLERIFGADTPIVRAMPNTPAAIGSGMSALVGNAACSEDHLSAADTLLAAVGRTTRLTEERQIDWVTAVSGSGPAYVFHLIEAMADAGAALGLRRDQAVELATVTVAGAGELAIASSEGPEVLRRNVTSPGGTTAAALDVLMDEETGLRPLMHRALTAAAARAEELGR